MFGNLLSRVIETYVVLVVISVCKIGCKVLDYICSDGLGPRFLHFDSFLQIFPADSGNSNSRVNSECDLDSVCSDSSWVITPGPTFQQSSDPTQPSIGDTHSLEDLLIEHPTMSVYRQNSTNEMDSTNREEEQDRAEQDMADQANEQQNRIHQIALIENERRRQLAQHMQIPLTTNRAKRPPPKDSKQPKLTRRALKRHNPMTRAGAKYQVQKCGFKAGRRRC